ncbi:hypothetical protein TNCV_330951 [Trichonephila clavipes]|nr:hypothetical protein TNCV_330951 [Trichonephila clavipes]
MMEDFSNVSGLSLRGGKEARRNAFLFVAGIVVVTLVVCATKGEAKKWTMEELAAARYPHKVSNDIYLDPCKSEMPDIKTVDNGLCEEIGRLNIYLNYNKLKQLENQHDEIDKRWVEIFSKNDQLCLVENSDQLLIKYPSSTKEGLWPTEIVDYLSGKSVVVLDETKQL